MIGIMLGDGSLYEKGKGAFVAIFGNSENEKEYMLGYVKPLMKRVLYREPSVYYHKTAKEIRLQLTRKIDISKMKALGLKSGNKLKNNIGIPNWIFSNKEFLRVCIKGLIDADGCVYAKWKYKNIPQIEFYSSIPKLQEDFTKAMHILGFKISKWRMRKDGSPVCGIYGKNEALKYFKEVGFNNLKNIKRFSNICPGSIAV
ncbi:MAG: LAGLIDADG family homing endonuclease [Candidatus Aenigmarchaeota archaeon]|nr:LAGLIDADG family homing endonuclease [Candidatus Aenigmarchaeota archaeon]